MSRFKSFFYFFLALTATFLLLEASIRLFLPQSIEPSFTTRKFGIPNALRANFVNLAHHESFDYKVSVNSKHLRSNKEVSYEKPLGTYRILCLGDSILFGYGVENNETFSHYLEEVLNKNSNGPHYEVINAAAPGWGPVEYLLFLQNEGIKYQPDLIITTNFVDDFTELTVDRIMFDSIHQRSILKKTQIFLNKFRLKPLLGLLENLSIENIFQIALYKEVFPRSHLLHLLRYRTHLMVKMQRRQNTRPYLVEWLQDHNLQNTPNIEWILPRRKFNSGQISQILAVWGKGDPQQSTMYQIANFLQYYSVWDSIGWNSDSLNIKWLMLELPIYQEVMGLANEATLGYRYPSKNFRHLSLLKQFIRYQKKITEPLFFPGDNHWTPAGHLLAALMSTVFLAEQNIIKIDLPFNFKSELDLNIANILSAENRRITARLKSHPKRLFYKALILKNSGKPVLARKTFMEYLERAPDDAETLLQLGLLDFEAGDHDNAIQFIKRAAAKKAKTRALLKLAEIYVERRDFKNAQRVLAETQSYSKVLAPEIHNKMGQLYLLMNQFKESEYFFRMALQRRPKFAGYRINYGNFLFIAGRYHEAAVQFKAAIQSDPEKLLAFEGLGGAYWKLGKYDKAILNFKKILRRDPSNETALATLKFLKKNKEAGKGKER